MLYCDSIPSLRRRCRLDVCDLGQCINSFRIGNRRARGAVYPNDVQQTPLPLPRSMPGRAHFMASNCLIEAVGGDVATVLAAFVVLILIAWSPSHRSIERKSVLSTGFSRDLDPHSGPACQSIHSCSKPPAPKTIQPVVKTPASDFYSAHHLLAILLHFAKFLRSCMGTGSVSANSFRTSLETSLPRKLCAILVLACR